MKSKLILIFTAVLTAVLCFSGCQENGKTPSADNTAAADSVITENIENDNGLQDQNNSQPDTTAAVQREEPDMCHLCGEVPVGDFEVYCPNCRCLKCDKIRKNTGPGYVYCIDHNCNESNCKEPAAEDSQYCVLHKCKDPSCRNRKNLNSEYCYQHSR